MKHFDKHCESAGASDGKVGEQLYILEYASGLPALISVDPVVQMDILTNPNACVLPMPILVDWMDSGQFDSKDFTKPSLEDFVPDVKAVSYFLLLLLF